MRTTPLISPPSCTSSRFAAMSPCTTLVDWISMRSSARMLPRTSPPMIASRLITSPSTSPPLPTSTCRPARTVPTTVPSIFTTPSAVMSPTTRIPAPMIERPVSDSGAHCNVDSRMRFCGVARAHLTAGHEPGNVERPLGRSGRAGLAASRRIGRRRPHGHGPHQIGVGGDGLLWGRLHAEERAEPLVARLGTVQGAGELLHAAVLLSQPRHLSLQHGRARRRPPDRPRKREKKHDREPNSEGAPLPDVERPQREPIFVRLELPVGMNDDRDAAVLHPSKGDPSINSS